MEDYKPALDFYSEAEAIIDALAAENPADARLRRSTAIHRTNVAVVMEKLRRPADAEKRYRRSLAIHQALSVQDGLSTQNREDVSFVSAWLGNLLCQRGAVVEAKQLLEQALALQRQLALEEPDNVNHQIRLARTLEFLGDLAIRMGETEASQERYRSARDTLRAIQGRAQVSKALARLDLRIAGRF
jgi:tetratricopeptide (TPR) repeat protein